MNKKVFLDTNILIDFFDNQRKLHTKAKELIHFLLTNEFKIVFSEDMISTIIYIVNKNQEAQQILVSYFEKFTYDPNIIICSFGTNVIRNACNYFLEYGGDFEDILQYFCAEKEECLAIYTNDLKFPTLKIPIKRYGEFNI